MNDDKPLTVPAAIEVIDLEKRSARAIDKDGIFYCLVWPQGFLDGKMAKLQKGYYREFSCERAGDNYKITSIKWVDAIPDWVRQRYKGQGNGGGGGNRAPPRDEFTILIQCVFKEVCETARATVVKPDDTFKPSEFVEIMKTCKEQTVDIFNALVTARKGVQ